MESALDQDSDKSIDQLIGDNLINGTKNRKSSARQRYNRRKNWLLSSLNQMEYAIAELLAQEGTVYKRREIDALKTAISTFYDSTGLKRPKPPEPTQEELDRFMDMMINNKPWEPPSKEEMARIFAEAGLSLPPDQEE